MSDIKKGVVQAGNTYADLHGVDPESTITVYRGVKASQNGKLTGGEWVTQDKELARLYSRNRARASGEDAKIIAQKVKAKELIIDPSTNPGVDNEFRYNPHVAQQPIADMISGGDPITTTPKEPGMLEQVIDEIKKNPERGGLDITAAVGEKAFAGFDDLTTQTLNNLKGKRAVQKQYIENLLKMPQLKQAEKDVINSVLEEYKSVNIIPVSEFADKVKTQLLPLNRLDTLEDGTPMWSRWESINLPDDLRGDVINYHENIYESPVKTKAGSVHFGNNIENYFAHTRTEDVDAGYVYPTEDAVKEHMAKFEADLGVKEIDHGGRIQYSAIRKSDGERISAYYDTEEEAIAAAKKYEPDKARHRLKTEVPAKTRRVIELQSDLFQRGRLEKEVDSIPDGILVNYTGKAKAKGGVDIDLNGQYKTQYQVGGSVNLFLEDGTAATVDYTDLVNQNDFLKNQFGERAKEISKLTPYKNTWYQRVIREEVKKAAQDGISELQFPTGKTAAQIEGYIDNAGGGYVPEDAVLGDTFDYGGETMRIIRDYGNDVDAVPESAVKSEFYWENYLQDEVNWRLDDFNSYKEDFVDAAPEDLKGKVRGLLEEAGENVDDIDLMVEKMDEIDPYWKDEAAQSIVDDQFKNADDVADYMTDNYGDYKYVADYNGNIISYEGEGENFVKGGVSDDLSPEEVRDNLSEDQQRVFDFYEKDIPKYLKKIDPNIQRIFDDNGVEWFQLHIDPSKAEQPVDAFAKKEDEENQQYMTA